MDLSMVTRTINIRESAYTALKARKREGESFSYVILRVTEGKRTSVCDFLQTIDPGIRTEIAESVKVAKKELALRETRLQRFAMMNPW